ncbi:ComE operon protein 1 [Paenibacillus konkukensis]|uniref:ComE operon protein 1 n=1 Tax=Paenibacillus konkukensis TaxID=2020716 RepID=A0ABY4RX69_9BACL|nr:helix-hairpin-helix domain-containing protein [Paenibacillus konkukensis]UQZ86946.1 ComE operon protein 1 [Paenibacillus konkukensis]
MNSAANKTKTGTVLFLVSLTLALAGWFGYTAWKETAREAASWRLANEEMRDLLAAPQGGADEQAEPAAKRPAASADSGARTAAPSESSGTGKQPAAPAPETAGSADAAAGAASKQASDGAKINLNTATAQQLDTLPGIGESKAKAIIAYRDKIGSFRSVDQLLEVKGIGEKLLAKMRPYVTVEF